MIFPVRDYGEKPLFSAYINDIKENQYNNRSYVSVILKTIETRQDGTKEYSSWYARLIGDADRNKADFKKGDRVNVFGFKIIQPDKQNEDGSWAEHRMYMSISRMAVDEPKEDAFNSSYNDDNELPF